MNEEDEHIETGSLHELTKREVKSQMRPFALASFLGEERLNKKQNHIIDLLMKLNPSNIWHTVDHVLTKVALFVILAVILTKCAG